MTYESALRDAAKARRARLWAGRPVVASPEVPAPTVTKITVENLDTKAAAITREIVVNAVIPVMNPAKPIPVSVIIKAVADFYGISCHDILSHWRHRKVVRPRCVAAYLMRRVGGYSLPRIGREMHRDHTTVLYSVRKIATLINTDEKTAEDVRLLTAWLTGSRS